MEDGGVKTYQMIEVPVPVFLGNVCRACNMDLTSYRVVSYGVLQACVKPFTYKMPVTIEASTVQALADAIIRLAGQIAGVYQ